MLGIKEYQFESSNFIKNLSIKDYTSQIGNLIRTINYDDKGNKLTETINHFLNDDMADKSFEYQAASYESKLATYNYQGVIQERYADARSFKKPDNTWFSKTTMSGREVYPTIQTGSTQIDYKNGTRLHQKNLGFDFYSGMVTKTLSTDSYGNRFETEVIPAYRQYAELGLKTSGSGANRKHMLTQQASSTTYKVNALNERQGVLAASAQTWAKGLTSATDPLTSHKILVNDENGALAITKQNTIWRQKANYRWTPNGGSSNNMTLMNAFQAFNFIENASNNTAWQKAGEIKRYNVYSNALEGTDLYENFAATRMGYKNSKVLVTASPARYEEVAYAGAEDPLLSNGKFSSQLSLGTGVVSTSSSNAHTGEKSLKLSAGQQGFAYGADLTKLDPVRRDYSVMVWVKPASNNLLSQARLYYKIGVQAEVIPVPAFTKTAAGWYLLELKVPASALASGSGTLTVGCKNLGGVTGDLYFDDFRFQPTNAAGAAYVYDLKSGELTHILDNNNLFTRYEYDAAGRLIKVYKEVLGKPTVPLINETVYNYGKFGQ
jgi:hypothetical protein